MKLPQLVLIYSIFTTILFLLRVFFFAGIFGGVEHDSGWYLGVAKNLAQRGIYASYTNTIREESVGAHPSIHGRFSVQDANGFSYFPAGVTVGPGYVVPEALLLKIFGHGWWQYRLWPLISFTLLLFILFYSVWRIGGIISLLIFQIWLWAVPQLTTIYAYGSYGEPTALFYLILSFILMCRSLQKIEYRLMFFSGILFSLAVLTKNLFLLGGLGFVIIFFWEVFKYRQRIKITLLRWTMFLSGFIFLIVLFEFYRYMVLVSNFGLPAWHAINEDIRLHFQANGSGLATLQNLDWVFVEKKINIWLDVAIKQPIIVWGIFFLSPVILLRFIKKNQRFFVTLIFVAALASFTWFIFISSTGWARHAWHSLIFGMMLISLGIGITIQAVANNWKKQLGIFLLLVFLIFSLVRFPSIELRLFLDQKTIETWRANKYVRGLEGFPHAPILFLADQQDLVRFFILNINSSDRVYYVGWFLSAEVSPLVDKVFYTLDRYLKTDQYKPNKRGQSYVIFGPYQQGFWSLMPTDYVPGKIKNICDAVIYRNSSYEVCKLRAPLIYTNNAYN